MGRIFYMMGKSASGKDTLSSMILEQRPELKTYVMYATRPIREGEKDGVTYHFTDEAYIDKCRDSGRLIEARVYNTVRGPWIYATIDDGQIDLSAGSYLMTGTLVSYINIRERFGADKVVPLYIELEDGERLKRAIHREELQKIPDYRELCRRFLADCEDFSEEKLSTAGITKRYYNNISELCAKEIIECIDDMAAKDGISPTRL